MGDPNGHNHLQFRSLAREFRTPNDNPRLLGLYFARDLFPNLWQAFDTLPEFPPIAGHFSLVADYLVSLMKNLPNIRSTDAPAVAEMTRALLASAVSSTSDNLAEAAPAIDYLIKERARRYIYRNMGNPALTPIDICRAIGVSRSKLYLAFADCGGVSSFIKHTRLMKAFEEISTISTNMATISSIADKLAFPDAATFSRAFRSEFGVTPRDVRNAAIKGTKILPPAPKLTAIDTFGQVLQQLRP
ncbi:helix-turn-helix domain-containing protein [Mesorhizobium sp. ANAO-SY3R2]|uniref:helix-turn-helix domain-containing protein n=1 Tax=Mesorhizobium sp. ANAO-SY3R2 TaxID=3166644 RepID=UPI00366CB60E